MLIKIIFPYDFYFSLRRLSLLPLDPSMGGVCGLSWWISGRWEHFGTAVCPLYCRKHGAGVSLLHGHISLCALDGPLRALNL